MTRFPLVLSVALLASAQGVSAQSLFNAAGLGMPTDPFSARARALGGHGVGLLGPSLHPEDPASAANILAPTATFTAQPSWVDYGRSDSGDQGSFRGTRFPAMGIAYPVGGMGVATFTFSSFLDQRYRIQQSATMPLLDQVASVSDRFESVGGVSAVRLGFGRRVAGGLAMGISLGRYGGSVTRRFQRSFDSLSVSTLLDFEAGGFWSYTGTNVIAGVSWNAGTVARLAGTVSWSSSLKAEPSDDTDGVARSYDLPLRFRLGGSALLAPGFALTGALSIEDWSNTERDFTDTSTAGRTSDFGVGVELSRSRLFGRTAPLRIGYRHRDLPFLLGSKTPTEWVWSGGVGLALQEAENVVLAGVDLSIERGTRSDDVLRETFWRAALTLTVAGF